MLFNKDGKGSEELFEISGTFHAAADYRTIESEIYAATQEVAATVGAAVVTTAEKVYASQSPSADDKAMLLAVQRPVAYLAISRNARLSGLSHGDTGRKLKLDDNEKMPFEWMIDRDDREMRERFYRAMDSLFNYLDAEHTGKDWEESWLGSPAKKLTSGLIMKTLQEVENVYPLEHSSYMYYKLAPIFREVQDTRLKDIIGEDRIAGLIAGDPDVEKFRNPAVRYTVLEAMVIAVQRWSIEAFPLSVARRFLPTYQGNKASKEAATSEIDWYVGKLELQAKDAALEMQTEISGNPYAGMKLLPHNDPRRKYFTT